jgi:hypothetical protein
MKSASAKATAPVESTSTTAAETAATMPSSTTLGERRIRRER